MEATELKTQKCAYCHAEVFRSTVRSEIRCALRLQYVDLVFSIKVSVVSLYSVVTQRLKCNTGKVCNCLIQFLLTVVLSIEERVFLVEYIFKKAIGTPI
jgi:hypothetical protein